MSPNLSNNVSVIDTATNTVVGSPISVGVNPDGITVTPNGAKVYVANYGNYQAATGGSVSVINVAKRRVKTTIPMASGTSQPAVTPDGKYLFVPVQGYQTPGNTVVVNRSHR